MTKRILIGASVLALSVLGATAAWANPENIFSEGGSNTVISTATVGGGGPILSTNTCHTNCGPSYHDPRGNATSESFNTNQNAISYQELDATSYGNGVYGAKSAQLNSGSATVSGGSTTSGVSVVSANSGNGSVVQQGVSLAALGTVNVGN